MKSVKTAVLFLAAASFLLQPLQAQEKPKAEEKAAHPAQLKVQIVFTEFEGEKKVKSIPYTSVFATTGQPNDTMRLRIGSRVPLMTEKDGGGGGIQFQYVDVGTNLDCTAERLEDGRFGLRIAFERSWIQGDVAISTDRPAEAQGLTTGGHSSSRSSANIRPPNTWSPVTVKPLRPQ